MSSGMYARRPAESPSSSNTVSTKSGVFATTTFRFAEDRGQHLNQRHFEASDTGLGRYRSNSRAGSHPQQSDAYEQPATTTNGMAAYTAAASPPLGMYVRAMYDYDADDGTSLSFRQGDIIQVITQLESGWWDGIINNERGWFPSNYCQLVSSPDEYGLHERYDSVGMESDQSGAESEREDVDIGFQADNSHRLTGTSSFADHVENGEEAAFWIPQATADGRLYYYNTLTGVATTELPLEDPTSADETGPRDRLNVNVPRQTRAPHQEETSASELEDPFQGGRTHRQLSYISDGASPTASMDDLNGSGYLARNHSTDFERAGRNTSLTNHTLLATGYLAELPAPTVTVTPQAYGDDVAGPPLSWNRLVENMERAVSAYRDAVNNAERSEYVRRAEDISDHLRMLLAAGSGTTDNHSGNPSIVSANKALYPHFRDMMSKFSKLVLSSHIAAADWPAPDSYSKCLQEAEGVLHGVYGYVEVARQQSGDALPRLRPGFLLGAHAGGAWTSPDGRQQPRLSLSASYLDQEDEAPDSIQLDSHSLERLDELRSAITLDLTRLDAHLIVQEKIITKTLHEQISSAICNAAANVVRSFKAYIAGVEILDIKGIRAQETQVATFLTQKQVLYDLIANVVVSCQAVAGPLGDEWADIRGDPFETRLQSVKSVSKQLETALTQITSTLHGILELVTSDALARGHRSPEKVVGTRLRSSSRTYPTSPYGPDDDGEMRSRRDLSKVQKLLGEDPSAFLPPANVVDDTPIYLRLDYEGEIAYDTKVDPPQIRGGTLTALVEQLTRHDRMDSLFNHTFLLTYRSFTSAQELFELLVKRFSIQPPQGITASEHQAWVEKKQKLVRFRVVNVLKTWIETYWLESNDEPSNDLLRRILTFATDSIAATNTTGASNLRASIESRLRNDPAINSKRLVLNLNTQAPQPLLPKSLKKFKLTDIDPLELARQLTILESKAYSKIKPYECLNKTWQKKVAAGMPNPAPNVMALITQSNQVTNWVAEVILGQSDVRKRVGVVKHFINVADKCRQLNNFSTLMAIITALSSASVHRLNRTWTSLSQKMLNLLESLRTMMGSTRNFSTYREALNSANPPCIPFVGVYLTDLTFIEDGIPSVIKKTNLINFAKRAKTADVIRNIQQYQNVPYPLQPVQELQNYITESMKSASDVHEMYDRSLAIEPREREDEKIARLLSESGFL